MIFSEKYNKLKPVFIKMMPKYESMWKTHLRINTMAKHRVVLNLSNTPLIHSAPYWAGPKWRELERVDVVHMEEADVADPALTECASPILFKPKKGGSLCFCAHNRLPNAVTVRGSHSIPRMDECIDSLKKAKRFSTLDGSSGYWQNEMDQKDVNRTASVVNNWLFVYTGMLFGVKNAPATFRRVIDVVLATVKWQFALVYLDDTILFWRRRTNI